MTVAWKRSGRQQAISEVKIAIAEGGQSPRGVQCSQGGKPKEPRHPHMT